MPTFLPGDMSHRDRHQLVLSGVSPRPIAFIGSQDAAGICNLSPYSFFNAFASNPPIVAIGPAIAARTGKVKDTWRNIMETGQCTISTVPYSIVHRMNIAAGEYPPEVDEFEVAGLTKRPSVLVAPPSVAESPYAMECTLMENIELRRDIGGNGNLMLLEVVAFHVADSVLSGGKLDPRRLDLVGRMGGGFYTRTTDLFEASQPLHACIGIDELPDHVRTSPVLTGNDLAQLAYVPVLPMLDGSYPQFDESFRADSFEIELASGNPDGALFVLLNSPQRHDRIMLHRVAQLLIKLGRIADAWQTVMME
ncbi:MAG: flavin reductase family protein [Candidatus Kapabacteria bacterium]|nr:flavin reductase family protein [Candidatus Kapabacteria bacterium]